MGHDDMEFIHTATPTELHLELNRIHDCSEGRMHQDEKEEVKMGNGGFARMTGKHSELENYAGYLKYIDSGEPQGCMSHTQWLKWHKEQNTKS